MKNKIVINFKNFKYVKNILKSSVMWVTIYLGYSFLLACSFFLVGFICEAGGKISVLDSLWMRFLRVLMWPL